jgi:hypothetical protein
MEEVNLVTLGENAQALGLKNTKGGKSSKLSTQRSSFKSVMARLKKLKKNKQGNGASDDSSSSFSSSEYESSSDEDIHYTTVGFS